MNNVIELKPADSAKINATELVKAFEKIDSLFENFAKNPIGLQIKHLEDLIRIIINFNDREAFHVKHHLERVEQQLKAELNYLASNVGYALQSFGSDGSDSKIYEKIDSLFESFAEQVIDVQLEHAESSIKAAVNFSDRDSFRVKYHVKNIKERLKAGLSDLASNISFAVQSFGNATCYKNNY